MVRQCNRHNSAKAAFIDSFSMTAIWKRKAPRLKSKPMEHEVILGIVNEHHHWTLVVIYPQEKKSLYLDPLGETKQGIQNCLESTRAFMRKKGCNVSRWTCDTVKHPKQVDATSCGVFALKFAEKILRKESIDFPSTKKAINTHRLQIATTLLLETDNLTNICHFCGEEEHETDNKWIQFEMCLQWFHQLCVKSPPPEDVFICLACT
nr:uncharacterized protein LOC101473401 [Maylandia zebra]